MFSLEHLEFQLTSRWSVTEIFCVQLAACGQSIWVYGAPRPAWFNLLNANQLSALWQMCQSQSITKCHRNAAECLFFFYIRAEGVIVKIHSSLRSSPLSQCWGKWIPSAVSFFLGQVTPCDSSLSCFLFLQGFFRTRSYFYKFFSFFIYRLLLGLWKCCTL